MSYRIALNFEDGATRIIDCHAGEKVLDAAYRNKINLPMDCSDGVCGTCKCRCEQGSYDLGDDYIEDALTENEAEEGLVLTCQMVPSSDCVVGVPVPSSACKLKPSTHGATLVDVEAASPATFLLRVKLDNQTGLAFLPGQYVNIGVPDTGEHRSYSFSSKPGDENGTFIIKNVEGGLMSRWLADTAKPGDRLSLTGPNGSFFLRAIVRPTIMLAGGTGFAPILSMLEVLANEGCDQKIHLIYGVGRDADIVGLDRIAAIGARLPGFTYATCVSDPVSAHMLKGYVIDHLHDDHLNAGDCDIYLCGPPKMVESVRLFLRDKGVTPAQVYYEKFAASEPVPA
jgi:benzoate/toluate 1,2-dioxygenase reductase subunit